MEPVVGYMEIVVAGTGLPERAGNDVELAGAGWLEVYCSVGLMLCVLMEVGMMVAGAVLVEVAGSGMMLADGDE